MNNSFYRATAAARVLAKGLGKLLLYAGSVVLLTLQLKAQTATAPTTATNIGTSPVGTAAANVPVSFTIATGGKLGATLVLTTGISGLDFTPAAAAPARARWQPMQPARST